MAGSSNIRAKLIADTAYPSGRPQRARRACESELTLLHSPYGEFLQGKLDARTAASLERRGMPPAEPMPVRPELTWGLISFGHPLWERMREQRPDVVPPYNDPGTTQNPNLDPGPTPPLVVFRSAIPSYEVRAGGQVALSNALLRNVPFVSALAALLFRASARRVLQDVVRLPWEVAGRQEIELAIQAFEAGRQEPLPPEVKSFLVGRARRNDFFRTEKSRIATRIQRREELVRELDSWTVHQLTRSGFGGIGFDYVARATSANDDEAALRIENVQGLLTPQERRGPLKKNQEILGVLTIRAHLDDLL